MGVQRDGCDSVYEYLELLVIRHFISEFRVQGVDALDKEDGPVSQLQLLAVKLPQSGDKIELRHLNLLSGKQFEQILLEIIMIHSVEVVEVKRTVRKPWSVKAIDEIVIRGE